MSFDSSILEVHMQSYSSPLKESTFYTIGILLLVFCCYSWSAATAQPMNDNTAFLDKLTGKVVFQRPDGIYLMKVGEEAQQRLVEYGTNPRWSPNGKQIAFIHNNAIMLVTVKNGKIRHLATAGKATALCFNPDGRAVVFTDNNLLRRVDIRNKKVRTVLKGDRFYEIDMAKDGRRLAATVKTLTGFKVRIFDLKTGSEQTVSKGCSASLSPDGSRVTVNGPKHRKLHFYRWQDLKRTGEIHAPVGRRFDNQFWSNNPQWLTSTTEGKRNDIFLHHVASNTSYQLTTSGDCDRADLYVKR